MNSSSSCCVFNVEKEVVVIRNGWTPMKKEKDEHKDCSEIQEAIYLQ